MISRADRRAKLNDLVRQLVAPIMDSYYTFYDDAIDLFQLYSEKFKEENENVHNNIILLNFITLEFMFNIKYV